MPNAPSTTQGFSLIELSIALVIIGLLVGGVLTGQSLIRAAELRSVTTEFSQYQAAAKTFRDQYFAIPGDMATATSFWGKDNAACTGHTGTAGTPGTCNGDGDNMTETNASGAGATGENFQFWKHLALSGLLEGSYTGIAGSGGFGQHVIGTNCPRSKLSGAGWSAFWLGNYAGDPGTYATSYGNQFSFGAANTNLDTSFPTLKPEEAWSIDIKIDDGKPARGRVISRFWNNLCAAADDGTHAVDDLNASYRLTDNSVQCALDFIKAF